LTQQAQHKIFGTFSRVKRTHKRAHRNTRISKHNTTSVHTSICKTSFRAYFCTSRKYITMSQKKIIYTSDFFFSHVYNRCGKSKILQHRSSCLHAKKNMKKCRDTRAHNLYVHPSVFPNIPSTNDSEAQSFHIPVHAQSFSFVFFRHRRPGSTFPYTRGKMGCTRCSFSCALTSNENGINERPCLPARIGCPADPPIRPLQELKKSDLMSMSRLVRPDCLCSSPCLRLS